MTLPKHSRNRRRAAVPPGGDVLKESRRVRTNCFVNSNNYGNSSPRLGTGLTPVFVKQPLKQETPGVSHGLVSFEPEAGLDDSKAASPAVGRFDTTRWSVVTTARDLTSSHAAEALEKLCRGYWYPLYAYARRRGLSAADAEDATQEFFRQLIERNSLGTVDRSHGNFRSFLMVSMNHLLSNEWDKARSLKRGGGHQIISLDGEEAEGRFVQEAEEKDSPEKAFDRRWALTLLSRALELLRGEFSAAGKLAQFDAFKRFLSEMPGDGDYAALGELLAMDAGRIAVAVHRLRLRYREIVRAEIAQTVTNEAELKSELNHLFESLD